MLPELDQTFTQGPAAVECITLVTYFQINNEVAKLPQSRFLPRPPGHDLPLKINMPNYYPTSSGNWLGKHGLKGRCTFIVLGSSL